MEHVYQVKVLYTKPQWKKLITTTQTTTTTTKKEKLNTGLTKNTFKARHYIHTKSFRNKSDKADYFNE